MLRNTFLLIPVLEYCILEFEGAKLIFLNKKDVTLVISNVDK
jgi:hypothetical protein